MAGTMHLGGSQYQTFFWSSSLRSWMNAPLPVQVITPAPFAVPIVQVTNPTPYGSPITMASMPLQSPVPGHTIPDKGLAFEPLGNLSAPAPTFSAKFVLEVPPETTSLQYSGVVYNSSEANNLYGPVRPLELWKLPQGLTGYDNLLGLYHYVPPNPLAAGITEGDTVLAAMNAIFQTVDMVLQQNCHSQILASFSESTSRINTRMGREQICRVDHSWAFQKGQTWITFAIVEFKRRGAIRADDWSAQHLTVGGRGGKICRQLKKCATLCRTRFVGCCDGEKMVLMCLGGDSNDWYRDTANTAPTTPAHARWIQNSGEMKRHLFVFLREALDYKLQEHGMLA